jgi:hypothetical protein
MKKWNSNGLGCVSLEQKHGPPNMVDHVKEHVQTQFVLQY